ncbi:MAG: hypothetical protein LBC69_00575 [Eubacteriaceae bacterium]|jgi:peptidoglycan glycosyltransferase|nr:hypothetical protein [Eubacteriaceae bacterium]
MAIFAVLASLLAFGVYAAPSKIEYREATIAETFRNTNIRGKIYDRSMTALVWNDSETGVRAYLDGDLYQPLIGYYSKASGRISGLEDLYDDTLVYSSPRHAEGNSLVLTLDANLQKAMADAMNREVKGAAIVMDAESGAILGMLSNPSYSPQSIDKNYEELLSTDCFVNKATASFIPGSVMKIVSAAAIVRAGLENEVFNDTGQFKIENFTVVNHAQAAFGEVALKGGIGYSVNTYFAYASQQVGREAYEKCLKDFFFGQKLSLDFASINSSFNVDTPLDLAVTAYGQGETEVSLAQVAMATACIANGGAIYRPYMVERIVDPANKMVQEAKPDLLGTPLTKAQAQKIAAGMKMSADRLGFQESYDVYSKTGTAETGAKGRDNLWLTSYFEHGGKKYVVTMALFGRSGTGSNLSEAVETIIGYIRSSIG